MENLTLLAQVNALEDPQQRERLLHELIISAAQGIELKTIDELQQSLLKADRAAADIEQLRAHSQLEIAKQTALIQGDLEAGIRSVEQNYFPHPADRALTDSNTVMAIQKLEDVITLVEQYLRPLLPGDRKSLRAMTVGLRRLGFVQAGARLAVENTQFLPPAIVPTAFRERIRNYEHYKALLEKIITLEDIIKDILLVSSSELYRIVLDFYHIVENISRSGLPDSAAAKAIYDELRPFFKKAQRHGEKEEIEEVIKVEEKIIEK